MSGVKITARTCRSVAAELLERAESRVVFIGQTDQRFCLDCGEVHPSFPTVHLEGDGPKVISHYPSDLRWETEDARKGLIAAMREAGATVYECRSDHDLIRRASYTWPSDDLFSILQRMDEERRENAEARK